MRTLTLAALFLAASLALPMPVHAQDVRTDQTSKSSDSSSIAPVQTTDPAYGQAPAAQGAPVFLENPLKGVDCTRGNGKCLESFLLNILDFVISIGTIVVILMVVLVGFKFVTAQGEPGKLSEARQMLLWTVVGALILLGAKAIALGIQATVTALGG